MLSNVERVAATQWLFLCGSVHETSSHFLARLGMWNAFELFGVSLVCAFFGGKCLDGSSVSLYLSVALDSNGTWLNWILPVISRLGFAKLSVVRSINLYQRNVCREREREKTNIWKNIDSVCIETTNLRFVEHGIPTTDESEAEKNTHAVGPCAVRAVCTARDIDGH